MTTRNGYVYKGETIEPCECGRSRWIRRIVRGDLMLADELSPHYSTLERAQEAIDLSGEGVAKRQDLL